MRSNVIASALLVLVAASLASSAHAAGCSFTSRTFHSYQEIYSCLEQVPFSDSLRQATLSNLRKTFSMYAFRDIVKNSPASGSLSHIQTDLFKEFDRIASASYESDWDFQDDVANVVLSLKDPHTVYQKGQCYQFFALQPFVLRSRMNASGKQEIWVSDLYFYATQWPQLNLQQFVNNTLIAIDGKPAIDVLLQWAIDNEFESKDPGSRFNRVLDSHYQQRVGTIFPLPDNTTQTYLFQDSNGNQRSVTVDWKVDILSTVTFDSRCSSAVKEENVKIADALDTPLERRNMLRERYPSMKAKKHAQRRDNHLLFSTKQQKPSIQTFNLTSEVVVTRIYDFEPADSHAFLDTFDSLMDYAQAANIPYMILDLRGNGGGSICLGYQLINRLMHERHPEGDYDVVEGDLMTALFSAGATQMDYHDLFGMGFFSDQSGNRVTNLNWYTNARLLSRGGSSSNYSQPVHHACKYKDYPTDWVFKKVIVVTDGLCGSTCAVVSTHLADLDHVDTLVVGGIHGQKQQYFSFPGGQVMGYSTLLQYGQALGLLNSPLMPRAFPNGAQQSFTFLEIYPWTILNTEDASVKRAATAAATAGDDPRLTTPLEFVFDPADFRLDQWAFSDDDDIELWNMVVPFFQQNPPKN